MRSGLVMWIGVLAFVVGLTFLILGASLNSIVESGIEKEVQEKLIVTASSGQDSKFTTLVQPYSYFFYNITNAKDVQNGSVPIVKEIEVKFTRTQQKYDFVAKDDTYAYREFNSFTALTPEEYDMPLITLNPVYIGAAIGQGASELGFQSALSPAVFQQLVPLLMAPNSFLKVYQLAVVPVYLATLFAACLELPFPPFNDTLAAPTACAQQWGLQNQLGGNRLAELNVTNMTKFTGWELPSPITANVTSALWNLENAGSLTNATGVQRWGALAMYAAQVAAGNQSALPLYNATLNSLITDVPGLDQPQAQVVLQYLGTQLLNTSSTQNGVYYFQIIYDALKEPFPIVEEAKTWSDLLVLQFSHSVLTQSLQKGNSIFNPVFEFMAYELEVKNYTNTSMVSLTLNETKNFLEYFQVDGSVSSFGATLQAIVEGRLPPETLNQFAPLGVRLDTVLQIAEYLLGYVPATFVLKEKLGLGIVQEDGTHPSNTGMFVKRTVREILHGYDDPLVAALGLNRSWTGLVGPEIHNETEAREYDELQNKTGMLNVYTRTDIENLGSFREWQGLTGFNLSTTLGGHCASIAWVADPQAVNCTVWETPEVIAGKRQHLQLPPFQYDNTPVPYNIFAPTLFRNVWFDYTGDSEIKEITTRRYKIRGTELKNEADNVGNAQAQQRSRNYRVAVTGFQDLSTVFDMTPIHLGLPRHYSNLEEHNKILGLTARDWNDTSNVGALETFLDIEPLTGKVMQGRQRLQVNIRLEAMRLNGLYTSMYTAQGSVMFPVMWGQEGDTISDEDAETFRSSVYGSRKSAKSWTIVLIIFGMIFMLLGLGALCKGWRTYRIKDANETMPLRASDKKAFI